MQNATVEPSASLSRAVESVAVLSIPPALSVSVESAPISPRCTVRCVYSDGDTITTGINATPEEARRYFLGAIRPIEDEETGREIITRCVRVDVLSFTPFDL